MNVIQRLHPDALNGKHELKSEASQSNAGSTLLIILLSLPSDIQKIKR